MRYRKVVRVAGLGVSVGVVTWLGHNLLVRSASLDTLSKLSYVMSLFGVGVGLVVAAIPLFADDKLTAKDKWNVGLGVSVALVGLWGFWIQSRAAELTEQENEKRLAKLDPKSQEISSCTALLQLKITGVYPKEDVWHGASAVLISGNNFGAISLERQGPTELTSMSGEWTWLRARFVGSPGESYNDGFTGKNTSISQLTNISHIWLHPFPFIRDIWQPVNVLGGGKLVLTFNGHLQHTIDISPGTYVPGMFILTNNLGFATLFKTPGEKPAL